MSSTPTPDPRREHASTYVAQSGAANQELTRLPILDQLMNAGMGGVLSEQPDPTSFRQVLDVGCATGGWLIETAKTYPTISRLIGVDVNERMVEYARSQAEAQGVSDRVQFRTMDVLRMLEFSTDYFDLVNQRFGMSFLRTGDWPKLLNEYQRVTQPGGVIRITEGDLIIESTSSALTRLSEMRLQALYQAGYLFTPESDGVTSELARLMQQAGFQQMQTRTHQLHYQAGTAEGQANYENIRQGFQTTLPFMRKWTHVPADYETIYQQALSEMQQPDFATTAHLLTVWGRRPPKKRK